MFRDLSLTAVDMDPLSLLCRLATSVPPPPLEANPLAPWELRIGRLRAYSDVEEEPARVVKIRAVGIKERDRVRIGGEEITLHEDDRRRGCDRHSLPARSG